MRVIAAGLLLGCVAGSVGAPVAAQDDCWNSLLAAPIELTALPADMRWDRLTVTPDGEWTGRVVHLDRGGAYGADVALGCVTDPVAVLDRMRDIAIAMGMATSIGVAEVGEVAYGQRLADDADLGESFTTTVYWARGSVMARVEHFASSFFDGPPLNIEDLEAIAQAIDAVLAGE